MARQILGRGIVATLVAGTLMAGCGHKNSLVGTWSGTTTTPAGVTLNTTLILTDAGKDTTTTQASGPRGNNRIYCDGNYTTSGDKITQTFTTLEYNGRRLPQSKGPIPEPGTFKIEGDTLTLVSLKGGPTLVLTRQKA